MYRNRDGAANDPLAKTACAPGGGECSTKHNGCPCRGRPTEVCGGYTFIEIFEIERGTGWGWAFVALVLAGGAGYLAAGVALGHRVSGAAGRHGGWLAAHPHSASWAELHGLVGDGLALCRRQLGVPHATDPLMRHHQPAAAGGVGDATDQPRGQGSSKKKKKRPTPVKKKGSSRDSLDGGGGDGVGSATVGDAA
eukprot:SAG31_NODE_18360_length_639_cov_0.838889_1_plen_194_part_01